MVRTIILVTGAALVGGAAAFAPSKISNGAYSEEDSSKSDSLDEVSDLTEVLF